VFLVGFIVRIYHGAQSSECQIRKELKTLFSLLCKDGLIIDKEPESESVFT